MSSSKKFRARIEVRLKKGEHDPEADTVKKSLNDLGFSVSGSKMAKVYELDINAESKAEASKIARSMCTRLLANPTKDEFSLEVTEIG